MTFVLRPLLVATAAGLFATAAWAAPSVSVPSAARAGQSLNLAGKGFAAGSVVTVRVTAPSGAVTKAAVVANAGGVIAHLFTPVGAGKTRIEFLDAAGVVLATADMGVAP